jgi:hypothetical protein
LRIAVPTERTLNNDTIFLQNSFRTLQGPLKKHRLKKSEERQKHPSTKILQDSQKYSAESDTILNESSGLLKK